MSRRVLLYGPTQEPVSVDDSEDKLRALCLAAFGALKGLAKDVNGRTGVVEGEQLERWQKYVASKIFDVVGKDAIQRFWNIRLSMEPIDADQNVTP